MDKKYLIKHTIGHTISVASLACILFGSYLVCKHDVAIVDLDKRAPKMENVRSLERKLGNSSIYAANKDVETIKSYLSIINESQNILSDPRIDEEVRDMRKIDKMGRKGLYFALFSMLPSFCSLAYLIGFYKGDFKK